MKGQGSSGTIGSVLDIHAMITGLIVEAVDDVPEGRMAEQPGDGIIVNHPAWTLSHLSAYAGVLLSMLDDPAVPRATADAEMERFGYGTVPVADRAIYAAKRELIDRFTDRSRRVAAAVAEKHEDFFGRPSPERFHPHAPSIGHIAITLLIAHPPHHLGQLRQWRRAAGLSARV